MKDNKIWCMYQQLGSHMWAVHEKFPLAENGHYCGEETHIDDESWETRMKCAKDNGMTMFCVDLAEGLLYPSHPELALKGTRSGEWMNERVRKLKSWGITPVPSLNFSTCHHQWLGKYSRMVSSPIYYKVVKDLMAYAYEVFEKPPMINFCMDEENEDCVARGYQAVRRQNELLYHDIEFFAETVRKLGARPWMWSDWEWWRHDEYPKKIAKDIVQTNWFYGFNFNYTNLPEKLKNYRNMIECYIRLDKAGYDQIPGCSNWVSGQHQKMGMKKNTENIPGTVDFCKAHVDDKRLLGFYCMPWLSTSKKSDPEWCDACQQLAAARKKYYPVTKREPLMVTLTFDDSTADHMIAAAELEKRGWRGSFNVITDWVDKETANPTGKQLTWAQCKDLVKRGHQVNSHTAHHVRLNNMVKEGKLDEIRKEVADSRDAIEKNTGVKPKYLCHPFVQVGKVQNKIMFEEGMIPMTDLRINFGGGDNDPDSETSLGRTIDKWYYDGINARDLMFHGIDPKIGVWRPFKTVDDFRKTLDDLKEREAKGMVKVLNYDDFYAFAEKTNQILKVD